LIFKKNGSTIYTSPYTNDLADLVNQANWTGSLGNTFYAPNGIDQIIFEHFDVANGYVGPGSVIPSGICINYQSCPTAIAGNPVTLTCTTPSAVLGSAAVAGNTYSWTPTTGLSASNQAQPSASPISTTTYTVTVTSASGCTSTSSVVVTVDKNLPTANAGVDKNLNCTTTSTTIGTAAIAGNSYSWSPSTGLSAINAAMPTANPSSTTTYTVIVTGSNGCTATDVVIVNVNTTPPTADAGVDKNLNCTTTSTTIGTTAIAGNSYSWSPATGLNATNVAMPTANPSATTTYTVTVTGSNGCTATDVVVVNVNTTLPTANAGSNKNLNCTTTSSTIGTTAIAGNSYSWSPATGLSATNVAMPTASPSATTVYTVTVTGSNGCTATSTVTVNVNTTPPTADAGVDKNLNCTTTSTTIGTTAIAGNSYSWSPATGLSATNVAMPTANPSATTTYTVTVAGSNGCTATDVVVVNVNTTLPTANAGSNQNLNCTTTSSTIGTTAIAGNSYSWSPATGLSATNVAMPTASPSATTVYTVTVTGSNGCTATSTVTVNVNTTPPTADAGVDKNLNCTTTSTTIGTTAIAGNSYSWSPATGLSATNVAMPTANPFVTTTYTVTVTGSNGCTATDVVTVFVNTTPPTVDAGMDKNHDCITTSSVIGTASISGNTYSWSPATGLSSTTDAQPTANPSATTTYTVTVTGSNGCTATDVVTVFVNTTPPTVDAGMDKNHDCNTTSSVIGTTSISGNTYSWSPATGLSSTTDAQPTANPSATTTYTVTVTGSNGCTATDVVTVFVNTTPPTVDAGMDKNHDCNTTSSVIGTASIFGNTYSWSPATGLSSTTDAQPTANPSATTTYTVTVTGSNGCTATDVVTVFVNTTPPTVDAGMDKNHDCITTSSVIGTASISGNTYSWSPATGLSSTTDAQPTANPSATTTYTVTVTGSNGCTATDVVTVFVNTTPPTVDAGMDKNHDCNTTSSVIGTASISGNTYSWSPATGLSSTTDAQPTANPSATTTYTVTVTGSNGCTATDVVTVFVNTTPPTVDAGMDKNHDCITTSSVIGTASISGNTYSWSPATGLSSTTDAQPTANPSATTTYTVTVTGSNGCTATDVVTVFVNTTPPTVDAGMDKNHDCITTSSVIGTASISGNTYSWSPATGLSSTTDAQPTANPSATTTYTVTVTGSNGCTATDVVTVFVNTTPPTVDAGMDKNHDCNTTSSVIGTASISGNTYSWSPATGLSSTTDAQPTANPSATTTYTVTVTGSNGCTATDVVTVFVNTTPPTVDAGMDKNHDCNITSSVIGTASISGNTYSWSPATGLSSTTDAQPTANPSATTTYTVTVTGSNGCTATDVVVVNVNLNPPTAGITGDLHVCNGSTTTLTATGVGSILWSNNSNAQTITVGAGTYSVTITDGICSSTSTVTVQTIQGTIGNYVWADQNLDGLQNEAAGNGMNGVTVELWSPGIDNQIGGGDDIMVQTTTTANDQTNNPGYYNFIVCNSGNYYVKFPTTAEGLVLTASNQTAGIDGNSDASASGTSAVFTIDVNGVGVAKDNNTIDAGYIALKYVGNKVWFDNNRNGLQDGSEIGVSGITVSLLDDLNRQYASTITDAYGNYYFNNLPGGTYSIAFTLPSGYVFTTRDAGSDDELDSDVNPNTGITDPFNYVAGTIDLSFDAGIYIPTVLTSEVGDKVWNDLNVDGIQDPNETGVAGVTVTLYSSTGTPVSSTITDADGIYNFSNVTPGEYYVGFSLPIGYVFSPFGLGTDSLRDSNPNPSNGFTANFYLAPGQSRSDIDAGIHEQNPANASIGNFVWNDINNNGIQDVNEPGISGVTVTLYDETGLVPLKTIITDVLGYYTFNDLPAGNYMVGFSNLPSGFDFVNPLQGSNTATDSDPNTVTGKTAIITLLSGQVNTTIDAGLHNSTLPTGAIGNYVWFDRNKDGIQDSNENGVGGVTVQLYNSNDVYLGKTITNNEGFYIFTGLNAGDYYVNFSSLPVNFKLTLSNEGSDDGLDSDPSISTGNTSLITLATGEVNLTIDAGIVTNTGRNNNGSLGDKVWNDVNQNGIQDIDELGVQGVTVTLYQSNGISVLSTTTTNSLGEYIFTNLEAGDYVIGFSNIPAGFTYITQDLGGDDELDSDANPANGGKTEIITLEEGDINLTIDAGIYQNAILASIGDYVWNDINQNGIQEANEPGLPGITVTLYNAANEVVANTTTDGNGAYQFTGLNAGTYIVGFSNLPSGYSFTAPNANSNGNDTEDSDVDTTTGRTAPIVLTAGAVNTTIDAGLYTLKSSLGNYVWEDVNNNGIQEATENGISGITVTLYDATNTPVTMAITNARGGYNFVNLEPGTYSVGFSNKPVAGTFSPFNQGSNDALDSDADPVTGITEQVTLVAGEYNPTLDAGIHLPTGAGLGDYVWLDLNSDGMQAPNEPGVPGVTVTLYDENDVPLRTTITDQNGAYTFSNLIPGTFKVGFSTLPTYYQSNGKQYQSSFTLSNVGDDASDSDVSPSTGKTGTYTVNIGQYIPTVDAGIKLDFVLPALDIKAFAKTISSSMVDVSWFTVTEINTDHFEIERSLDGSSFEKVAQKAASGNTFGNTNYNINDNLEGVEHKDVIYYRIKMVDQDGKFIYSNTVSVKMVESDAEVMVYPSPFTSNVNVLFNTESATTLSVRITDLNGNTVDSKFVEVSAGRNIISFDNLSTLSAGVYMIMISDTENGTNTFFKITKQ
jgi:hypothetical protein